GVERRRGAWKQGDSPVCGRGTAPTGEQVIHGSGDRTPRRWVAFALAVAAGAVLIAVVPRRAAAHEGGKIRGACVAKNASGRATVTLIVENVDSEPVRNLIPADITGTGTGDATFFVQTTPRASRELLPGKRAEFLWKGRFYGNGFIDLTVEVGGEFPGASETTGLVNCNRVAVGNPDGEPPTATRES